MNDTTDSSTDRTPAEAFRHYDADDVRTDLDHVSGWVPRQNVDPLTNEVTGAEAQYWSFDGSEAFVTTLSW
ncbi:hypothetical protein HLRTI_000472 [Halorhabdus tiamatea SARL4B]|uniref:Uncharacterized protein n=1 Tax=Halorhabdus tiamatea SARL4B TaxID=1033806 RepID=F7PMN1_9EURY|nr:hypothetical protein HLRTI_000472 [Halorhabdus tiamatea SARL4B]